MSTSSMNRLTQFPPVTGEDGAGRASFSWSLDSKQLPKELIALSWADLLRSFTTEQSPVFILNDAPVKADLLARAIQSATLDVVPEQTANRTAVVIGDLSSHQHTGSCTLLWHLESSTQSSTLHSSTDMDAAFLRELAIQLGNVLQKQATKSGVRVDLSTDNLPTLSVSNSLPVTLPGPQLLHKLALGNAHESKPAVEFLSSDGDISRLSYHSLDRLSSKLAAKIVPVSITQRNELQRTVVPVLLPQSMDLYITWLAILKAGGAFCPLNIDAPPDRIEFILQDLAASVLVTQAGLKTRVPQNERLTVITVDDLETDGEDIPEPAQEISPSDLAYVMYTSGSTGHPKGVGISHLAATQSLLAHNDLIPCFNRFLQFASPTFDVSVFEVFFSLMRGATLIGCEREHMLLDIGHVMTEMNVDAAELTPTVAGELLRNRAAAPSLRVLLTIGEMLSKHVVEEFGQSDSSSGILHGMYGPTEAAIHCTAATHFLADSRVNLIGKPFKTVSAFIMSIDSEDEAFPNDLEILPLGQIGELVVGGSQLAEGYINRPDENARAFIESPQYGRLYRTGDKARLLPSGEIECFGRIANGQVKLRGQRIELGEIEHVICKAPSVRSAVALVSGGSLAAFVLASDKSTTDRVLKDICRQWLPRFMVPGEFIFVSQFPQLPSGKVDRKALEAHFVRYRSATTSSDQQNFFDECEEVIASCVADVLGRPVSSQESMMAAGLDSLAAIRLASHLLNAGIRMDVTRLLEIDCVEGIWHFAKDMESKPAAGDMNAALDQIRKLVADAGAARLESLGLSSRAIDIVPCSHIQQAMLLETVRHENAYFTWIELEVPTSPSMNSALVREAFVALLERTPLLRSGFVEIGLKDHPYACLVLDALDESLIIKKSDEFDYDIRLIDGSDLLHPLQIQFMETPRAIRILVHIHHALYDGWSWQLMLKDLRHVLHGKELPSKPTYNLATDFFLEYQLSHSASESISFWRDYLQGSSGAKFPRFQGRTDVPSGTQETRRLLEVSLPQLKDLTHCLRVSRQTIFQAAYCYLLSSYLGSDDVVFGTVFSGRTLPIKGIEMIIGPCIQTLPTRLDLGKMQNVTDLLLAIQNANHKSLEHGSLPLHDIKRASGIALHANLFDTALVWQESIWCEDDNEDLLREVGAAEFLDFALLLSFEPKGDKIYAKLIYDNSILPCEQAQLLLEQIDCVASILIRSPSLSIRDITGYLPQPTLSVCNEDFQDPHDLPSILSGVDNIAKIDPQRLAIQLIGPERPGQAGMHLGNMNFGQMNAQANCFSRHLLRVGVEKDALIAIMMDSSFESYISLLAVAKIGAGILPISPGASSKTIRSILKVARPQFCMVGKHDLKLAFDSIQQIHFKSSDDDADHTLGNDEEGFYVVCPESCDLTNQVRLSDYNLRSHINVLASSFPVPDNSKLLQTFPQASAGFITNALFGWHTGMTICSAPDEFITANIQEIIRVLNITHLHLTPSLASRLRPASLPSVRCLMTSGEYPMVKVHQDWAGKGLYPGYSSPVLTGICAIATNVTHTTSHANIGLPLNNTSAMIVANQETFRLLPRGATGELCFGGAQVAWINSSLNRIAAGRFIDHAQFGRVYRTGELGRLHPDGSIMLSPQRDQVKLDGQFVDLDEIDRVIIESDLVENAISLVWHNPSVNEPQLATIWVPSEHCREKTHSQVEILTNRLFKEIASRIPTSSIPSLLVAREIPMTEQHKTDFAKIRQIFEKLSAREVAIFSRRPDDDSSFKTFTDVELAVAAALSEVTGVHPRNIRRETSFYKLGLDSLSAISLSRKLRESGFGSLDVSTILRYCTVAQLATVVSSSTKRLQAHVASSERASSAFDQNFLLGIKEQFESEWVTVNAIYPCTPVQEAMLATETDAGSSYLNHLLLRVNVGAGVLKAAWNQMLQRHDILRTCFSPTSHKQFAYAQVVLSNARLPWSFIEATGGLAEDVEKRKSYFEHQSPVNGELPYWLTAFADPATHDLHLLVSIHHALYDGEGIARLMREVQDTFAGQKLPQITPFYRFIDYMLSVPSDRSDHYWDGYLSGLSPTLLSKHGHTGYLNQITSHQVNVKLSLQTFKRQCKDLSVTPLNIFHASWARLLALHSDSHDVCFGNVFSCRTIPVEDVDSIVGPCFNTLPVRIRFSAASTNADIMKLAQKHNNDTMPHQLSPLRRIQNRVFNDGTRLFDTLFVLQTHHTELDARYWELLEDEGNMGFPLVCEIVPNESHNEIRICLHFRTSHLNRRVAERLAEDFVALVQHTTQFPFAQAFDRRSIGLETFQTFEKARPRKGVSIKTSEKMPSVRPWSHPEGVLRDIFCGMAGINVEAVGLNTTMYQLGLDSINAVQISATLRKIGYKVSAGNILEAASIEKVALLLDSSKDSLQDDQFDFAAFESQHLKSICAQLQIPPQIVQAVRPCTPVQNGMLAHFINSHGQAYLNRMAFKSSLPLEKVALKKAWWKVMAQHEMLRTGFVQLCDQEYPFAMITYRPGLELPWYELLGDVSLKFPGVQEMQILENLHRPPWAISLDSCEEITTINFLALHALYDAQSLAVILSDVMSVYEGRQLSEPASIAATVGPILIESHKEAGSAQDFWQGIAEEFHPTKFPDLNPVRTQSQELLEVSICSCPNLESLEGRCREVGVTLQAAGQAAWARLLSAYTGETQVVFGTVLSGRNLSAFAQNAVFPCLVTIPVPFRIEGSNRQLLERTMQRNGALVKNQFTPLTQIQRWLGRNEPLFDTLFVYQKFATSSGSPVTTWEVVDDETRIDYPVSIELVPQTPDLRIRMTFRSDLVPRGQAMILLDQYNKLLTQTLFAPDSGANDLQSLERRLLSVTPAKERAIPTCISLLHQFVEENASKIPEMLAYEFASGISAESLQKKTWSYRELNNDGNRVARFLQQKGIIPGEIVAICFEKCPEASFTILGILKAGCAYLAIDPGAPMSRKQFILEDSGAKMLLCNQSRKIEFENLLDVEIQALDEPGLLERISPEQPLLERQIRPSDTSYCLYTSGTTGAPKGCEITHENAIQAMLAFRRLFSPHWDQDSRWLQFASFHFDVSVLEQYWSWSVGICVTSCPRDLLFEDLPGTIRKLQITHIDLTPSLARLIHPDEVPSLCRGVFITGGEALKQEILDAWGEHGVIYNGYGPTEVTIGCTMLPRMRANDKPSNIGPQFDNVGSYVFRPGTSTPVLRGGLGELCVSGLLVGKGYLNRPELTKERFPFLPEYGDRVYRTGDLVRILHDDSFQFVGRIDDQVKLRGQRLEIGEINEVIKQATPEVNEVATLVIKHPKQSKDQLVSFVTSLGEDQSCSAEISFKPKAKLLLPSIKGACNSHLPGYMVPTHIIPMTKFPLSANNKVEMKVLKNVYQELSLNDLQKLTSMFVDKTAKSDNEVKIISILREFMGSPDSSISPWSSIYELGLDSISVISFSRRLKEAGFSQAQPSLIMRHPTISDMASVLGTPPARLPSMDILHRNARQAMEAFAHRHCHTVTENIGVDEKDIERIAPCTPLQEGIIYQFLSTTLSLYCSSFTFDLDSTVNLDKLQDAWSQAQREVQMLRARFSPSCDGYAQVILKTDNLPWYHLNAKSTEEMEDRRRQRFERWVSKLEGLSAQLWEIGVVQSPTKAVMSLNIFHALYDGNSLALLLELVAQCYFGQRATLQRPPDFLDILHLGPLCKHSSEKGFWTEHLADCHNRSLATSNHEESRVIIEKAQIDTRYLDSLKKALGVTEQAILHASWLLTLHQHYAFVPPLGIITSGRTIDAEDIAGVIGPLFNTIPSNIQFHNFETWSQVARRCHEFHVSTIPFQNTALRDIMKWLRKSSGERLFDSLFVFQKESAKSESLAKLLWHPLGSEALHDYPLALEILRRDNEDLTLTLAAKGDILSAPAAQTLLSSLKRVLSDFAGDPERRLVQVHGLTKFELAQTDGISTRSDASVWSTDSGCEHSFKWTPEARRLRDVIASLADVEADTIAEYTSIFEVGLDSIDAIKLSSRLSKYGIKVPVSLIMRQRTIKSMIRQLAVTGQSEQNGSCPLLDQMERDLAGFLEREKLLTSEHCRILPATPIQEAMIAEMSASRYQRYYNHEILQIEPHVDMGRLKKAWEAVIRAHPILRTSFVEVWDPYIPVSYAQVVHNEETVDFQTVELNGQPVDSIIEMQRERAYDEFAGQPLLTLTAAIEGDNRYLVLSIAHALYDGWSINLLHEDISRSYSGNDCTRPPPDAVLEQIIASSGERAFSFWKLMLSNCTPLAFPTEADAEATSMVVHRAEKLLSVCTDKAEAFCRRHGVTMQTLLVSCWSLVLASYVKQLDVVFGLVLSGRNVSESENVMFPTMNTVAMRVILHGTRLEFVKYVQEILLEISEHQHFPLRRVKANAAPRQLFDTLFIYQKTPLKESDSGTVLYKSVGGTSEIEYPVCAEVEAAGAELIGRVACLESVLGEKSTSALLDDMSRVLSSIIDDSTRQTIEFTTEDTATCGSVVVQDAARQGAGTGLLHRGSSQKHWIPLEKTIRNVLAIVSGVPEHSIDKQSNIFQLGLDSISAIKVAALLKRRSVRLTVSDMLKAATIERMAEAANSNCVDLTSPELDNALKKALGDIDVNSVLQQYQIERCQTQRIMPATAGQTYFLSMHILNPDVFYPEFYYLVSPCLEREVLQDAWTQLTIRAPMLRTAFMATGSWNQVPYIQAVLENTTDSVVWHEGVDSILGKKTAQELGMVPVTLHACQSPEGTALVLHIHHVLYDAVSLPSMIDQLAKFCGQTAPESEQKQYDLSNVVAYQHVHSTVDVRRQFWQGYLGQFSTIESKDDSTAGFGAIQQYYRRGLVSNMSCVEEAARRQSLSVQSMFLAVFARVYARILFAAGTSNRDLRRHLVVGLYLANRSDTVGNLGELMVPTVNIVPLRLDDKLSDDHSSLSTAALRIQSDINRISMIENTSVSLLEIEEWTGVRINTCVNFLRLPESDASISTINHQVAIKPIQRGELMKFKETRSNPIFGALTSGQAANAPSPVNKSGPCVSPAALEDVFMPTLDVEAAIRDGQLDFGLFGPESRINSHIAQQVFETLQQEMIALDKTTDRR